MSTEPKEAAPMPTLVERLRRRARNLYLGVFTASGETTPELLSQAADRIASLEAEVAALRKDGERRRLTFTAPQAQALLEMFGGEAGEVTVGEFVEGAIPDDPSDPIGEPSPAGLWGYHTEYPEEGAVYLGDADADTPAGSAHE